jgi:hypothetical protein
MPRCMKVLRLTSWVLMFATLTTYEVRFSAYPLLDEALKVELVS